MARLRSDSPLAKRIVSSFLQFLNSVELSQEDDSEAIIVASQCLTEVFGLDGTTRSQVTDSDLVELFKSSESDSATRGPAQGAAPPHVISYSEEVVAGCSNDDDKERSTKIDHSIGASGERVYEQFKDGLESVGYFDGLTAGTPEYENRLEGCRNVFAGTLQKTGAPGISEQHILSEAFKVQGNDSMAASRFNEAINLYTMAISLCGDNAVYYSNRAAAHTQAGEYEAAIGDSNKAIQLDPNYSKAYSRLGLAYYAQGKYQEAIEKGFQKAHLLDPNSKSIKENLEVAQRKLEDERVHGQQSTAESSQQQQHAPPNSQGTEARFSTTIPLNLEGMAPGLFPAVASLAAQFAGNTGEGGLHTDGQAPEMRMDGNMNVTVEGDPQFAGMMQSMLQMFGGVARNERTSQNPSQSNQETGQ